MAPWIYHELKSSRLVKFLVIHMIMSVVVGAMIIKEFTNNQGTFFPRYLITLLEAFFGSFGGAFLSIVVFLKSLFLGYGNTGMMELFGHSAHAPAVAGVAAICGFLFVVTGIRSLSSMLMYLMFILASFFFMFSSYVYFVKLPAIKLLGL